MLRTLITMALCLHASQAWAEDKCGHGDVVRANAKVRAGLTETTDRTVPRVYLPMNVRSEDGSFELTAAYRVDDKGFRPTVLSIRSTFAADEAAMKGRQRIRWRIGGAAWETGSYSLRPERLTTTPGEPLATHATIDIRVAQWSENSPGLTFKAGQLDLLRKGGRIEVQRIGEADEILAEDVVDYPAGEIVDAMFREAWQAANHAMKPCKMLTVTPGGSQTAKPAT